MPGKQSEAQATSYDFIVIGSGSAGGALTARLSENGQHTVLCLEAGEKGSNYVWSRPPAAVGYMYENPAVNWCYHSEPNETIGGRSLYVPRGRMLGGTSSINGMIYNRGIALDYDTWAEQGCQGWSYKDVLPYFKKLEATEIGVDSLRGRDGPMKVTVCSKVSPFYDLFIRAAQTAGVPHNDDYSGASQIGVAMAQQNVVRGRRISTATQYLGPARQRANVTIESGAEATSLILEGNRCVGVRYRRAGVLHEVRARREVIVSCGAANSPKLLELSGIGNPDILNRHGIEVRHALHGVGENLRDHYGALMKWRLNTPGISIAKRGSGWRLGLEVLKYLFFGKGFISQGMGTLRVFMPSRPGMKNPDIMMVVAPFMIELIPGVGRRMSRTDGFFMYSHPQRTESTGSVHIQSADPAVAPAIDFRFLQTETDRQTSILAVKRAREIVQSQPLGPLIAEELQPGPAVQTDDEILGFLRTQGLITNHMVGTCRMGRDDMAVVDERLRVRGMHGLRVADASVMPTMPSGNTSIPCIMVGEKCADMVLADAREANVPGAGQTERHKLPSYA
ncbi:MAG: GMC family oxidoreductase N-terminal domain-containing protein [Hydrogenophaga sp.]|nr:GMC family oxidoreductase N-terminal domain-containing protein [Hydrogenophaga sp.]